MSVQVRRLTEDDAAELLALRQQALTDAPLAFQASPEDDRARTVDAFREMLALAGDSAVFGAFHDPMIGMLGLHRDARRKVAHKVLLWGMYIVPDARGAGAGRRLIEAALDHARSLDGVTCARISVTDTAPEAKALYERLGFVVWGTEPDAVRHDGQTVSELHMGLSLA